MAESEYKENVLLQILRFNQKGNGVGDVLIKDQNVSVEIPFAIPGDAFEAPLSNIKRKKMICRIENAVTTADSRIKSRCLHFGVCGGCRWQQMSYTDQLHYKEEFVHRCFSELLNSDVEVRPIIPCSREWGYRNKMEFSFSTDAKNNRYLGLIMDSNRGRVINLTECHLVNPWFTGTLDATRQWWEESLLDAYHPYKDKGSLRTLVLRESMRTGDRLVMLTVSGNPNYALNKQQIEKFVAAIRKSSEPENKNSKLSIFLRIQQAVKGMPTNFYEMLLYGPDHLREILEVQTSPDELPQKLYFNVSPTAFFQPNSFQAEVLYSTALQMSGLVEGSVVYDLYCGTGTLGICAARKVKTVISIEVSPESALDARTNAANNNIENITILSGAVRHLLKQIKEEKQYPLPDLVVIDPPRSGIDPEAMEGLLNLNAAKILYISCSPQTQADNIHELLKNGYKLVSIQPIDQFAQTPHIENIAILEKRSVNECFI